MVKKLLDNCKNILKDDKYNFKELEFSQSPKTLVIGCCDSRVDPALLFNVNVGEIFVVRNIANIVPGFLDQDSSLDVTAAIEYAVNILDVDDIIVLGHSNCGGVNAMLSLNNSSKEDSSFITKWVKKINSINTNENYCEKENINTYCEKENIRFSLNNLLTYPWVKDKISQNKLNLHGVYFSIKDSVVKLYILNNTNGIFEEF